MTQISWTKRPGVLTALVIAAASLVLSACAAETGRPAADSPAASPTAGASPTPAQAVSHGPEIVDFAGVQEIRFGDLKADLVGEGRLTAQREGCGPTFTNARELSPVFDGERLVLIWVNPPYRTPEGVTVGTPLSEALRRYPSAQPLAPPAGSYVFPGLLVSQGDRAYLLLHDGKTVQKTIAGYTEYVNRLYRDGFGQC
jgi:hypothetical protein